MPILVPTKKPGPNRAKYAALGLLAAFATIISWASGMPTWLLVIDTLITGICLGLLVPDSSKR